ncbi:MAG TPA: hypothetical protein DCE42_19095 [Myxococcales bacterium]|nr:hypothetical protein [Deltaproteobacteria bacterium]MBK03128.1 hypothetical protein [Deltaproteobacteria bacterium]MBU47319.1 hypothetical protein [Deltaproteobacteria bacterium]HAA56881.1 hypothetical protein [Myxococcales bacterium]|tara:strand:+ start:87 stop:449 length:363 start_codon:yes stop_codon:yes gene_type:complete
MSETDVESSHASVKIAWIYHLVISIGIPVVVFLAMPKNETAGMGWVPILNYSIVVGLIMAPISIGIYLQNKLMTLLAMCVYAALIVVMIYFAFPWTWIVALAVALAPGFYFSFSAYQQLR